MMDDAYIDGLGNQFCIDTELIALSEGPPLDDCYSYNDYKKVNDKEIKEHDSPQAELHDDVSMPDVETVDPLPKPNL